MQLILIAAHQFLKIGKMRFHRLHHLLQRIFQAGGDVNAGLIAARCGGRFDDQHLVRTQFLDPGAHRVNEHGDVAVLTGPDDRLKLIPRQFS